MIDEEKYNQFGEEGLEVKGITIHNTSNYEWNARQLFEWLNTECTTSQGCHYLVDHNEIIEVMPLTYHVWHTGKANDFGNLNTIAIEICSNRDRTKYLEGQTRAINLIKELLTQYNLNADNLYFHNDFNQYINCPANIMQIYKSRKQFIQEYFSDFIVEERGEENEII